MIKFTWELQKRVHGGGLVPETIFKQWEDIAPPVIATGIQSMVMIVASYTMLSNKRVLVRLAIALAVGSIPLLILGWAVRLNFMMVW